MADEGCSPVGGPLRRGVEGRAAGRGGLLAGSGDHPGPVMGSSRGKPAEMERRVLSWSNQEGKELGAHEVSSS